MRKSKLIQHKQAFLICALLLGIMSLTLFTGCEAGLLPEGDRTFRVVVRVSGTAATSDLDISFLGDTGFTEPDGITPWSPVTAALVPADLPWSQEYEALVDRSDPSRALHLELDYELVTSGEEITALITYEEITPGRWNTPQILYESTETYGGSGNPEFGSLATSVLLPTP